MGFSQSTFAGLYQPVVDNMPLSSFTKRIIVNRYIESCHHAEKKYRTNRMWYHGLINLIAIAGAISAALSGAAGYANNDSSAPAQFPWVVMVLTIIITFATKLLDSGNVSENYVLYKAVSEKLHSEGWKFAAGIEKYETDDLEARAKIFTARIEALLLMTVENFPGVDTSDAASKILAASARDPIPIITDNIADSDHDIIPVDQTGIAQ